MSTTVAELVALVQAGDVEKIRTMLDGPGAKKLLNRSSSDGEYILHVAARLQHSKVVELLLLVGANPNQESEERGTHLGYTAAHYAASNGDVETLTVLANFKADFNRYSADKWTPLHVATFKGRMPVMALLVSEGADVNCTNNFGQTPALFAVNHGRVGDVRFLIKHKADVTRKDLNNDTLLHHALHYRMSKMFEGKYDVPEAQLDVAVLLVLNAVAPSDKNLDEHEAYFYLKEKLPSLPAVLDALYTQRDKLVNSATELNYLTLVSAKPDHFVVMGIEEGKAKTLCQLMANLDAERIAGRKGGPAEMDTKAAATADPKGAELTSMTDDIKLPPGHSLITADQLRSGGDPSDGKCPFFQKRTQAMGTPTPTSDTNRPLCPFSWAFVERHQTTILCSVASFILGMWADQMMDRIFPRRV